LTAFGDVLLYAAMIENYEPKFDYSDVLIKPNLSDVKSRKDVNLEVGTTFNCGSYWSGVPVMAANMSTVGTHKMALALSEFKIITCLKKGGDYYSNFVSAHPEKEKYVSLTLGLDSDSKLFVDSSEIKDPTFVCVDVANGYMTEFHKFTKKVREKWPKSILIAGNVVTHEGVVALSEAGADMVKVGIGSGSMCLTRRVAGVGYPQLSAVLECVETAEALGIGIVADGGIVHPGDFAKAFVAGAAFVMAGGVFAGHDECGGEIKHGEHGELRMLHYGMSSKTANEKYNGGLSDYRASEGRTVEVPYRGPVQHTIQEILGGLRSACSYVGAFSLPQLYERGSLIKVNRTINNVFENHEI
jgi:GMP reductase